MRRPIIYAVLTFLLLAMQHEGLVHPLGHLDSRVPRPDNAEVALPHAVAACAECALLAAGSSTINSDLTALQYPAPVTERAWLAFRSRAADAPRYYLSRAPPILL
jgi:hypothetical protein